MDFIQKADLLLEEFDTVTPISPPMEVEYEPAELIRNIKSVADELYGPCADKSPAQQAEEAKMWGYKLKGYIEKLEKVLQ